MKNYTSTVDADTTIYRIEQQLIRFGARNISKDYSEGQVTGIFFTIIVPEMGVPLAVRLPASVESVEAVLQEQRGRSKRRLNAIQQKKVAERVKEQAKRTAWKLIQDWIEVQLSLVEMKQAEAAQVFMPYMWNQQTGKTFFNTVKESKYKGLTYKPNEETLDTAQ